MKVAQGRELCKRCSFFQKFNEALKSERPTYPFSPFSEVTYLGYCNKSCNFISEEYLKSKNTCPFVESDESVRLLRIWSLAWKEES